MTHGGKREGAGRKSLPPQGRRKPHTIWLTDEETENARWFGGGNVSEGTRKALEHYRVSGWVKFPDVGGRD